MGLETLAATIGEEAVTLEDVYEPLSYAAGLLDPDAPGPVRHPEGLPAPAPGVPGGLTAPQPDMDQLTL